MYCRDFPGGPAVKNPPSNAGDTGLIPGWGTKIPHATGQLSLRAANYRAHALWSLRATIRVRNSRMPQLEGSPCAATKTQRSQK